MASSPNDRSDRARSWLGHLGVDLRCGEVDLCWLLFAIHFLLLTFQYTSKSIRQSIYIDALGAEQLPFVYSLVALCAYPVLKLYGRLVDRWPLHRLFAASSLLVAASLVGFWWLFQAGARWVSVAFYLWIAIVGILLVSQFWSYSSYLLDARQAKRLFGFIGAGGLLGGIAGGQIARWASRLLDTYDALLVAAGVLLLLAVLMRWRGREAVHPEGEEWKSSVSARIAAARTEEDERGVESLSEARDGLSVVRGSRYLQLIAAVMLVSAMVAQVIDLQFAWAIEQSTTSLNQRTAVFGNLYSVTGLAALGFQLLFTSRIHRRLGVGFALRVLPLSNGLGTVLFAVAAAFVPALLLPAVWLLKIGENGFRYSLDQASRELLFLPVPAHQRAKAKAFLDVFVQRAGKGLAAVALLSVTFGWLSVVQSSALSLAWIGLWLVLLVATQPHYVAAFRESLLRRELEPDAALKIDDPATLEALVEGLGSADPREVLHSIELLAAHGRGRLVPPLMLYHGDVAVRCKTLEVLCAEGRCDATALVEKLLADPEPAIRVAATRALAALGSGDVRQLMVARLADPDARIRAAAVSYLAELPDPALGHEVDEALDEMLGDGDAAVRCEAARAIGEIDEPRYQAELVQLLYDADPQVVRRAIDAVSARVARGSVSPLYVPILVSHLHHRKLKHEARSALVGFGESIIPALQHFMNDAQEEIWVRRALPKTIARIGGRGALVALTDSLDAQDHFLRRKVIEALLTLGARDRRLRPRRAAIEAQLAAECRGHLRALVDLVSLGGLSGRAAGVEQPQNGSPHLLERLLAERMDDHRSNLFNLLALIHSPRDIRAAFKSLESGRPRLRAHALEYLDNLLAGEVRRLVFAVIDDLPAEERLRHARRLFGLAPADAATTLGRLAAQRPNGDADAAWLTAAALQYIHDHRLEDLYPAIRRAAEGDGEPLVQETAGFLLSRIG